jgi:hypothetical protein
MTMKMGRIARLLATTLMATGVVVAGPVQASAAPEKVPPGSPALMGLASSSPTALADSYSPPTSTTDLATGRIDVFQSFNGSVQHKSWTTSTGWAAQPDLGTPPGGEAYLRPAASWTGSRLDVFVFSRGDHHIYQKTWTASSWSGWVDLGGVLNSSPAAKWTSADRLEIFAIGADGRLYQKYWQAGTGWSAWTGFDVPGSVVSAPALTSTTGGSRLDVFVARVQDGHLFQKSWIAGSGWTGWGDLGGGIGSAPVAEWTPSGVNRLDIFVLGPDIHLYQKTWTPGSGWSGLGGLDEPVGGIGTPPSITWGAGASRLDVFMGAATDGHLHDKIWLATTGWGWWLPI